MGESEGGREERDSVTTDQVARAIARDCFQSGREFEAVVVRRITEGIYAVEITEHGGLESERFVLSVQDAEPFLATPTPNGGNTGGGEDG